MTVATGIGLLYVALWLAIAYTGTMVNQGGYRCTTIWLGHAIVAGDVSTLAGPELDKPLQPAARSPVVAKAWRIDPARTGCGDARQDFVHLRGVNCWQVAA